MQSGAQRRRFLVFTERIAGDLAHQTRAQGVMVIGVPSRTMA